jgi:hypothetical protein
MNFLRILPFLILTGLLIIVIQVLAFSNPTSSPPQDNTPPPINTGTDTQTKQGGLNIQGDLNVGAGSSFQRGEVSGIDINCDESETLADINVSGGIVTQGYCVRAAKIAKRVFVTSTSYSTGNLGGLSGANAICQARADAAGLGGTWRAWLSDSSTSAKDNIGCSSSKSYQRLDGQGIAESCSDLTDGSLQNSIYLTENLTSGLQVFVWTGTRSSGQATSNHCLDWASSSRARRGTIGYIYTTSSLWTDLFSGRCNGSTVGSAALYCFEF